MSVHLILGGARSGKSSFAETLVLKAEAKLTRHYIATAQPFDEEMERRIAHHQERRGESWTEHECPIALAELISQFQATDIVLVDCLTLWMNNVIYNQGKPVTEDQIRSQVLHLVEALNASDAKIVLVSNEVGLGVVPMGEVTRLFVDHAGWMNQAVAKVAKQVIFIAAGLPLELKG